LLKFIIAFLSIYSINIFAQAPYKDKLGNGIAGDPITEGSNPSRTKNCNTASPKRYDGNTAVSFWGDSRLDLVDNTFYGNSSLDVYLEASGWNVQNFGVSGRQSKGVNDEITECFKRENDYLSSTLDANGKWVGGGDPIKPYYTNFITSKNVAFEIGGNDFVNNIVTIYILPPMMISYLDKASDEIYYTVKKLRIKGRNVLLIGNYAAISWSLKIGNPKTYGYSGFNPKVFKAYQNEDTNWRKDTMDDLTPILKRILVAIPVFMLLPFDTLFTGGILAKFAVEGNSQVDAVIQSGQLQTDAQIENLTVGSYDWWLKICSQAPGTIPALGVTFLEPRLAGIISNEAAFAPEYYAGTKMYYLSTFEYFLHPLTQLEPYVVNQELMTDVIHKNHVGYMVWGKVVGNKIRELNWNNNRIIGNATFSDAPAMNLLVELAKIKSKYEARLALIKQQLTEKIALINERVSSIGQRIAEIEEAQRQAELARQEAERQRKEEERLAQEAADRAAAQLRADEDRRRADALRIQAEEQRIAAAEAAARAERERQAQLLAIAACFFLGVCHR
jgi:hypothetical protein